MLRKKKQLTNNRPPAVPSQSAPVFSYYSSRNIGEQARQPVDRLASGSNESRWIMSLPSLIAMLIIGISFLYSTSLKTRPALQMHAPENKQQLLREPEFYDEAISKILSRSILNRNKLTIDTNKVTSEIESAYPELGEVAIILPLISRNPVVNIYPSQSVLTLLANNGSFIIDEKGRAVLSASEAPSAVRDNLPKVVDESGFEVKRGQIALPREIVSYIQNLFFQLDAKQVKVKNMTLPKISNELHVRLDNEAYYIKFDLQTDSRQQAGAFLAVHELLKADNTVPTEYIDVRIADKVFYK